MMTHGYISLLGHLGRDPDTRHTQSGKKVVTFQIATTERWTAKDGGKGEHTSWFRCVCWGYSADFAEKRLRKGDAVHVDGAPRSTEYEKDGEKRYGFEVNVRSVILLGEKKEKEPERDPIYDAFDGAGSDDIPF